MLIEIAPSSAQEFLEYGPPKTPACLVLDIRMPGLTGLDLQEELSRRDIELPIVFVSGHGNILMSVQAMKKGAQDFLTKLFDEEELIAAIKRALERAIEQTHEHRAKREIQQRLDTLTPRDVTSTCHSAPPWNDWRLPTSSAVPAASILAVERLTPPFEPMDMNCADAGRVVKKVMLRRITATPRFFMAGISGRQSESNKTRLYKLPPA